MPKVRYRKIQISCEEPGLESGRHMTGHFAYQLIISPSIPWKEEENEVGQVAGMATLEFIGGSV